MPSEYSYNLSVKSDASDELINVYLLRPAAGLLVRILYNTSITPNQLTLTATLSGLVAASLYLAGTPFATVCAGACITLKDVLDSADGQLARAKQLYSRAGRFLDSIGDLLVNCFVFAAIGYSLTSVSGNGVYAALAFIGLLGTTLRVSYHVYYHTSFLHLQELYSTNRLTEEVRPEDLESDRGTLFLQRVFQVFYGWQDRLIMRIDRWCRGVASHSINEERWFADKVGLRLSGFLGLGTELFLLTLCSLANQVALYLYCNILLLNGIFLVNMCYRKVILAQRSRAQTS